MQARAINDRGWIAGLGHVAADTESDYHAVLWRRTRPRDLGTLGGSHSLATDVNDRGQVVGWAYTRVGATRAFLWEKGRMRNLGTLSYAYPRGGRRSSEAEAINESGQIVGTSSADQGETHRTRAFLWENGRMRELSPFPGGTDSGATAINERGQIVGWSSPSPDRIGRSLRTVVWENGRVRDLGITTDYGGAQINDRGRIVTSSGVLWDTGRTTDLCALSGDTCSVSALNERGQIVGDTDLEGWPLPQGTLWQGRRWRAYRFRAISLFDINNRDQMVSTDNQGHGVPDRAHLWTFRAGP